MQFHPETATARQLAEAVRSGALTAEAVARTYIDRVVSANEELNIMLHFEPEAALEQAGIVDAKRADGETLGPLAGVPIVIKDNICVRDGLTTCASRMLESYRPPFDATVIGRIRQADGVLLGKANLDEFAMGSSTENSHYGPTRNPWDRTRIPGGSSGGSAAAVAADFAPLSLGSDTGGSIRQPAALCGVSGFKPTYGRVSRFGLVAFASSLDQIGPMAHDAADLALLFQVIAGGDPLDSTCIDQPVPTIEAMLAAPNQPLRIGLARQFFQDGNDPQVEEAVRQAVAVLEAEGAQVIEVDLPMVRYGIPAYYVVAPAECSSNLARYDGTIFGHRAANWEPINDRETDQPGLVRMMMASRAEGFGAEVKRRIMLGTFALSAGYADAYYRQALKVRRLIRNDFDRAFESVDVLVGPTTPTPAFPIGEKSGDPLAMYLADIYTVLANMVGIPGVSIPCGFSENGLPIGLQLHAPAFHDETLIRVAWAYQQATDWHTRRPPIVADA